MQKLLFVAKGDEDFEEGFHYAVELAKTLGIGIEVLLVYGKKAGRNYEDMMAAVAFAEAGDRKTAKEIIESEERELKDYAARKIEELKGRYRGAVEELSIRVAGGDVVSAVKDSLKKTPAIDMVLISPSLSGNERVFDLKKLLKNVTRPVVAMKRAPNQG